MNNAFQPTMGNVRINKIDVLKKLKENRDKHASDYETSMNGYKAALKKAVAVLARKLRKDESFDVNGVIQLAKPQSYLKDYDRAIRMLEMSCDETVVLEQADFDRYILDEWHWKAGFNVLNSTYSAASVSKVSKIKHS